jgi:pyruvate dehydrogenase E2 component (dihydrolipoamide acetyltransferase)
MPKYGLQQDEGTIVRWLKQEGDVVAEGDVLCELETDKALFDFEATEAGVLRQILCAEGETVPVLSDIAILTDTADEAILSSGGDHQPAADTSAVAESTQPDPVPSPPAEAPAPTSRIRRSPAAFKLAEALGVDLASVTGSGPNGRITREDVQLAADASSAAGATPATGGTPATPTEGKREPLSRMRKAIGRAMVVSKQTIPHFYVSIDIDATDLETWWTSAVESDRPGITLTDVIVKAAADTLSNYPTLNARLEGDDIITNENVHIGLAVGTDGGLLVPVIDSAESKPLSRITEIRSDIVAAARQGKLASDTPATFTISNLGMFGIREFSAIINPPECAALAIGTLRDEVRPGADPAVFQVRRIMTVTLSADHRLVDGLICARYLQDFKSKLEDTTWL